MNSCPVRRMRTPTVNLNPLGATLAALTVAVANKGFMRIASPLNAALTKYQGDPFDTVRRISIRHVGAHHAGAHALRLQGLRFHKSQVTSHTSRIANPESRIHEP
jgi:hypothetical protein